MSDVLIKVDGVSKKFCRSLKKSLWYGMQDLGNEVIGKRHGGNGELRADEFWAVDDVSFELRRGECLGLIGHNGAGKTTLLRMLNGLIKPDHGRIEMRGRVGALIALGAGFNPILTGRENIYVNASVLGMSKREIDEKLNEIIDFAEIGEFIDAPVQIYSSGMNIRLGFAIASMLKPDILLLDEVLAVGDAGFRFKCYRIIDELLSYSAVIFVSHNMPDVARISSKTILLSKGSIVHHGNTESGILAYQKQTDHGQNIVKTFRNVFPPLTRFEIEAPKNAEFNMPYQFEITVDSTEECDDIRLILNFFNSSGEYACNVVKDAVQFGIKVKKGTVCWDCRVERIPLKPGLYSLAFHLLKNGAFIASVSKIHLVTVTGGNPGSVSDCILEIDSWVERSVMVQN